MSHPPPPTNPGPRKDLPALTGLRFFAAFHVVLFHTHGLLGAPLPAGWSSLVAGGHHAVTLFFVLSGFVLHHTYQTTDWSRPGELGRYAIHRFARIYPLYLLSAVVDAPRAISFFEATYPAATAWFKILVSGTAYLSLTQTWLPRLASAWNPPGWSLSNEAFFYLLLPWMLPALSRLDHRRTTLALGLAAAGAGLGPWLAHQTITLLEASPVVWIPFASVFPPLRVFEFAFGVLLGRWFTLNRTPLARLSAVSAGTGAAAGLVGVAILTSVPILPEAIGQTGILLPAQGVLILFLALGNHPIGRLLAWGPIRFLGGASYAIYLLHLPLFVYFRNAIYRASWAPSPEAFAAYLLVVVATAALVFRGYEEPLRRFIRRRWTSASPSVEPGPPPPPPIPPPDKSKSPPG